ncbi:Winged helix DNA-binding domain protein [Halorhabdus tiamatea SARL4B]|uniref:Winged helix DNA-binding domain protein n=1 Tax=Halorhabdus tiamatea SARL4B TaxID=1033806 RepID=U2E323_9EURY|nr:DNA-binding protein [Halorhabdus tiamatea]ERJ06688.1 Winged helix DNA-binding domain protein [Halorhabdus tiamatea SARL4B]
MPDSAPTFENVNERAKEDWKRDTTPFDRVRSVMRTAYDPMTAATVAEKSLTSEQTARKHLRSLVEHGYVTETASPDSKATLYRRANDSLALEQARRILDETDVDTLSTRVLEMREQLREYGERFNADSPDGAVRAHADIDPETLMEWRTTRRNLAFAEVALALSSVEDVSGVAEAV